MEQMAVNSFDDVLNTLVTDEADRGVLGELVNKYPGMKEGWLSRADYSRKMDTLRESEKTYEETKLKALDLENKFTQVSNKVNEWETWASENWDPEAGIPKMEKYWKEKAVELEGKIGQDMTFDDIDKFITEKGVVRKADFDTTLSQKEAEINKNFQGSAYFAAVIAEKQGEHLDEFKKPLKVREFVSKLNEYGTNDLDVAYDKYVYENRKVMSEKADEVRVEKIRQEERKKAEDEFAARTLKNGGMPVDSEPGMGHLEAKVRMVGDPDALDKANLGDGSIARIAAQKYREDKLGVSQA